MVDTTKMSLGIVAGIGIGIVFGVMMENIGVGIALGAGIGIILGIAWNGFQQRPV